MQLKIMLCETDGTLLDAFTIEPGPRDKDVATQVAFAERVHDYLSMRYEMPEED